MEHTYLAIDLKSFYASVECRSLDLNPMDTNLVVADPSRTEKTICLAVSPSLKALGIDGRPRLFEVVQAVRDINDRRRASAPGHMFRGRSFIASELAEDPSLELGYVVVPPHMSHYMEVSARIYGIYLDYVAPEDIHVYSIDEVFMDVTHYLGTYRISAHGLAVKIVKDVLWRTGIAATVGIGPNLYLCKTAMDIMAKHIPADRDGMRIAELDEMTYRRELWSHRPITDFWRVGHGTAARLKAFGMDTMGDVARMSVKDENLLYGLFGVNAELLIDHAWGCEDCTMAHIKAYRPQSSSLSTGQVLPEPYGFEKGLLIVKEMADNLALDLLEKRLVTNSVSLYVGYDSRCPADFKGSLSTDWYGRKVPKSVHGGTRFDEYTNSSTMITRAMADIYLRIVDRGLCIRRVNMGAGNVVMEGCDEACGVGQPDLFEDHDRLEADRRLRRQALDRERRQMLAALEIKRRFGRNAIVRGMDLEEGARTMERNGQIGGHKA